jgi:hypothetical protein
LTIHLSIKISLAIRLGKMPKERSAFACYLSKFCLWSIQAHSLDGLAASPGYTGTFDAPRAAEMAHDLHFIERQPVCRMARRAGVIQLR